MPIPLHRRPLSMLAAALFAALALAALAGPTPREPLVGSPCEGCEAAFDGRPREVPTHLVLHSGEADAVPLHIEGEVRDADGRPRAGIVVYLHQTNAAGVYPPTPMPTASATRRAAMVGCAAGYAAMPGAAIASAPSAPAATPAPASRSTCTCR